MLRIVGAVLNRRTTGSNNNNYKYYRGNRSILLLERQICITYLVSISKDPHVTIVLSIQK